MLKFIGNAKNLGSEDLLLPILFVAVDNLTESSDDELKALIAGTQWFDWTVLRLENETGSAYATGINELTRRLESLSKDFANRPSPISPTLAGDASNDCGVPNELTDDSPGVADLLARFEIALPSWQASIEGFSPLTLSIAESLRVATEKLKVGKSEGKTFGHKILVARDLAHEIDEPATRMRETGEAYAAHLLDIDPGVRALIDAAGQPNQGDDDRKAACAMFKNIRTLIDVSRTNAISIEGFVENMKGPAKQFKDLRPPFLKINQGLRSVLDGQAILEEWDRLIEDSSLTCSDLAASPIPSDASNENSEEWA